MVRRGIAVGAPKPVGKLSGGELNRVHLAKLLRSAANVLLHDEPTNVVRWFEGNFTEYEEYGHRELGVAADQPHRLRYKKLAG